MKNVFLFVLIMCFGFSNIYSQEQICLSTEIGGGGYYNFINKDLNRNYTLNDDESGDLGYGFSFMLSRYLGAKTTTKLSFGVNYSSRDYFSYSGVHTHYYSPSEINCKIVHFDCPLYVNWNVFTSNKFKASVTTGAVVLLYNKYENWLDEGGNKVSTHDNFLTGGISFRFGFELTRSLTPNLNLNFSSFADYKTFACKEYVEFTGVRLNLGLKLGVEYLFNL